MAHWRNTAMPSSPQNPPVCAGPPCLIDTPLLNAPFSADATTTWQPPASTGRQTLRATTRYYRDAAGRVRVDLRFVGHEGPAQLIILAPEPGSRTTYLLDTVARTSAPALRGLAQMMVGDGGYNRFLLTRSAKRFTTFFVKPSHDEGASDTAEEALGESTMAGVRVTGTRFATLLPGPLGNGHAERWFSPELGLLVYGRSEDTHFGLLEYQLTNIRRAEPRSELFEVPDDYRDAALEFPFTWESAYGPRRTKAN